MTAQVKLKINPNTCPECDGWGQTKETRTEMRRDKKGGPLRTVAQGSGCPKCRGTGVL